MSNVPGIGTIDGLVDALEHVVLYKEEGAIAGVDAVIGVQVIVVVDVAWVQIEWLVTC